VGTDFVMFVQESQRWLDANDTAKYYQPDHGRT